MSRYALFAGTNIAVVAVLSIILAILGPIFGIPRNGMAAMVIFSAGVGFAGAIISLIRSKKVALSQPGMRVIEQPNGEIERWLVDTVSRQAKDAGIGMPDVAIYEAPEMNAFATGAKRNDALVAVSTGLMHSMNRDEVEAVLAHEVSHIANGDMITMTLLQGVVNTFVIFIARMIANVIMSAVRLPRMVEYMIYNAISIGLQSVFGIGATVIVRWFSRRREFRADAGAAKLANRDKMVAALQRLAGNKGESTLPDSVQAFGISGRLSSKLFMTHPPLESRIQALKDMR